MKIEYLVLLLFGLTISSTVRSQATNATGATGNDYLGSRFLGWNATNGASPLTIRTNNITRMYINGATTGFGVNTSGFIGVGTAIPAAPIHIVGFELANNQTWKRGLTLGNNSILQWDGGGVPGFFMGHASSSPNGNWYSGINTNLTASSGVNYTSTVFVNDVQGSLNPLGTTQFFKNVLVYQENSGRRFGVNTFNPQRAAEIYSNTAQMRLSYGTGVSTSLTGIPNVFTDFTTNASGFLEIDAQGSIGNRVGIETGAIPIGNTLHINSLLINSTTTNGFTPAPGFGAPTGTSGLRFEDLRANSIPQLNPGPGVLSLNATGDVIYVPNSGGGYFDCNANPSVFMPSNSRFNLNNNNFYFEPVQVGVNNHAFNRVGIGQSCGFFLRAKLDVMEFNPATVSTSSTGILGTNWNVSAPSLLGLTFIGVNGIARGIQPVNSLVSNFGGSFRANGADFNTGAKGEAFGPAKLNIGLHGHAYGSSSANWGVFAQASPGPGSYAVFAMGDVFCTGNTSLWSDSTIKKNINGESEALTNLLQLRPVTYEMDQLGYPNLNLSDGQQHGFISQEIEIVFPELIKEVTKPADYDTLGNLVNPEITLKSLNYNGIISINTAAIQELNQKVENISLSDQSIKTNVTDLNNSLSKVLSMHGVSFDWTSVAQNDLNLENTSQIGFIAQEIQQVDPRLTFIGTDSLLHVKYEKVVPILVEAIEELNDEVETKDSIINDMNARLSTLENCLSGILPFLCQLSQSSVQANTPESQEAIRAQLSVKLTNKETIVLDQNVPNPFAEQTVINFSIPETVQKAQIHFYNAEGRIIQSVDVLERGLGSLTVFGSDLSTGVYTYTLVADGISVATKKMMKN